MKKALIFSALILGLICLTSCQVNWFGGAVDVPWYVIAIPVAIIFIAGYVILMSTTFICPKCQTEFKAKPYQMYVTVHMNGKRLAKCPKCGKIEFCRTKR